jgi:hypothetical protein
MFFTPGHVVFGGVISGGYANSFGISIAATALVANHFLVQRFGSVRPIREPRYLAAN